MKKLGVRRKKSAPLLIPSLEVNTNSRGGDLATPGASEVPRVMKQQQTPTTELRPPDGKYETQIHEFLPHVRQYVFNFFSFH